MNWRVYLAVTAMILGIAAILASVGGPAAVASYHHAYEVFKTYGEAEDRAAWLPLTTDGMLIAALVVMYSRRWAQQRIGFVPWLAFAVGFLGTIAANLASANIVGAADLGEAVGRLAAAVWAPISFAVTLELVAVMLGMVRNYVARKRAAVDTTWPATHYVGTPVYPYVPVIPEPERPAVPADPVGAWLVDPTPSRWDAASRVLSGEQDAPASRPAPKRPARPRPARPAAAPEQDAGRPAGTSQQDGRDDVDVLSWIAKQWDRDGRPPTVKATRTYAGGGNSRASRLLGLVRDARPAVRPVPAPEQDEPAQDAEAAS